MYFIRFILTQTQEELREYTSRTQERVIVLVSRGVWRLVPPTQWRLGCLRGNDQPSTMIRKRRRPQRGIFILLRVKGRVEEAAVRELEQGK